MNNKPIHFVDYFSAVSYSSSDGYNVAMEMDRQTCTNACFDVEIIFWSFTDFMTPVVKLYNITTLSLIWSFSFRQWIVDVC